MNKISTLFAALLCVTVQLALAQISITNSTAYTQNFDGLPATGTSTTNPIPANWWRYAPNSPSITAGTGSSATGGFYSAGAASSSDRAFGSLLTTNANTNKLYFGAKFVNNTGSTIVSATVSYRCEQWRRGNTNTGYKDTLLFEYATGTDSVYQGSWTLAPALTGSSTNTGTTAQALDGNTVFSNVSGTVTGMAIPNGATFWIRFNDFDATPGSDDLLAVDDFSISFTTGTVSACTEPATSVTNVVLTATGTSSVSGSFTGNGADGYLVLLDSNAAVPTITDATSYSVGQLVGTATVLSSGSGTTFSKSGLVPNTTYKAYVYPYNNVSCTGGPNYKIASPGNDTAKTLIDACPEPTSKPTNLQFTLVDNSNINGKFTKSVPAPSGYVVVYSTSSNIGYPLDSIPYVIGDSVKYSSFKSKVAYVGTDSNFTISGLTAGTRYYFAVVPYNTCSFGPNYLRTTPLKDDTITSGGVPPCAEPDTITGITVTGTTNNSITATFTPHSGGADGYLVVYRKSNSFLVGVNDGTTYTVGQLLTQVSGAFTDSSYVGYIGTNTTFTITGLELGTNYYFAVFPFNNTGCTGGPNYKVRFTNNVNKTNATTTGGACVEPNSVPQNLVFSNVTGTTIAGHFKQQVIADGYVVVIAKGFIANLRDSVNYVPGDSVGNSPKTYVAKVATTNVDTNFTISGLTPNTSYGVAVYSYKICNGFKLYKSLIVPTVNQRDTTTATGTGVRNAAATTFSVFPNPVQSGELSILFKQQLSEPAMMEVIDVSGRRLVSEQLPVNVKIQTIDVSAFSKGIYLVNIRYKNENSTISFLVE
jgi:hypothetical protein